MPTQAIDSTPDLVLLVVRAAGGKLSSITRLQKLVFLITENPAYKRLVDAHEAPNPEFRPYKMGPFTPELYEAVQVLTSFEPPLLAAKPASPGAQDEVETALFVEGNDLDDAEPIPSGGPQPAAFALTGAGKKVADYLWRHSPSDLRAIVDAVVRDYGRLPLRELLRRVYQRKPYAAHQGMFDATAPHGWGYYWKSHFLPPLTDDCIDVLVEQAWQKQSRASYTLLFHMGGAVAHGGDSAFGGRSAAHTVNLNAAWTEGGPSHPSATSLARSVIPAFDPHAAPPRVLPRDFEDEFTDLGIDRRRSRPTGAHPGLEESEA